MNKISTRERFIWQRQAVALTACDCQRMNALLLFAGRFFR